MSTPASVNGKLLLPDGTAPPAGSFVQLDLKNIGTAQPTVDGVAIYNQKQFTLSTVDGSWSGSLYRNDNISCNGVFNSVWAMTYFSGGRAVYPAKLIALAQASADLDTLPAINLGASTLAVPTPATGAESALAQFPNPASTWTCVHNFGTQAVHPTFYDLSWNEILPDTAVSTDVNTFTATFLEPQAGFMVVVNVGNWTPSVANPNNIIGNPVSSQSIAGDFPFTFGGSVDAKRLAGIRIATDFNGADIGAKINAADADLGATAGEIWVTGVGTVSTTVSLSAQHTLRIFVPLTWTAAISPTGNGVRIIGNGAVAVQTLPIGTWFSSGSYGTAGKSDLAIEDLWVSFTSANNSNIMMACFGCAGIQFNRNHIVNGGGLYIDTSATSGTYANVNSGNLSSNVRAKDNYVDGTLGPTSTIDGFALRYVTNAVVANNQVKNLRWAHYWWGGDANTNGALVNTRWATDLNFNGGTAVNTQGAWWGSMGQDVTVTGVTVDTSSDIGLDAEGCFRASFSNFTTKDCTNGGIGCFYLCQDVEFGPGTVTSTSSASTLASFHNASADPTLSKRVKVHDVHFISNDASALSSILIDPIGGFEFIYNTIFNATVSESVSAGGSAVKFVGNSFYYTFVPVSTFKALSVKAQGSLAIHSYIQDNHFFSSSTQSAGTYAIESTNTDFNFSDLMFIERNTTVGFTNDVSVTANSANAGMTPTFIFHGNNFGANSVTTTTTGSLGAYLGELYNSGTNMLSAVTSPLKFGTSAFGGGTNLARYARYSLTLSPAAVAANTTAEQSFATSATSGDVIIGVSKPTAQAGLGIVGWRASGTTLFITFSNNTAGSITPTASEVYQVVAVQ